MMVEKHRIERGYKPSQVKKKGKRPIALPEGWKPYVYRGDRPFDRSKIVKCGTPEGFLRHLNARQQPCFDCCEAKEEEEMKARKEAGYID